MSLAALLCTFSALRYTEPPLSSQNLSKRCAATVSHSVYFRCLFISRHTFSLEWCKNWCKIGTTLILHHQSPETVGPVRLRDFKRTIKRPHCFNLFISKCLCVSFHRSADISMPHHVLKHLNVNLTLTHTCAEGVPKYMGTDFGKITRLPILFTCPSVFFFVIRGSDALDRIVNERLRVDLPVVV